MSGMIQSEMTMSAGRSSSCERAAGPEAAKRTSRKPGLLEALRDDGTAESSVVDDQQRQSGIHVQRPAVCKLGSVYGAAVSWSRTHVKKRTLPRLPSVRPGVLTA